MASQPHPLCPLPLCPTANGSMGAGGEQLAGSPETGDARLKPPVGPKPRTLPKPTVPAKPCAPPPSPGPRAPRLELPSAEKINLLAGPKPYGGSSTTLKRLSFGLKSPPEETPNGKGSSPPAARDPPHAVEEALPAPVTPPVGGSLGVLKGATPFKVKPVAAKPERFPGTTVEEILAKMERPRKEGPGSPDQAWGLRSTFSLEGGSRFGPKGYAAFRRQSSTEGGEGGPIVSGFESSQESGSTDAKESRVPCGDELGTDGRKREGSLSPSGQRTLEPPDGEAERDPSPASRESGSSPAGASCDGDQSGHRRPPSPPGFSLTWTSPVPEAPAELPLGAPPGSPGTSAGLAQAPVAPYLPAELLASAPGSPALLAELPAPGSPSTHANLPPRVRPSSPDAPESLAKIAVSLVPDVPAEPCRGISRFPGSPEAPGEGFPAPSGLPGGLAPGTPDAPIERPHSPPAGQPLAPGPPEAPTECPQSPPAGRPLTPGPPDATAELPRRITHSPGAPKTPVLSPDAPSLSPKLPTGLAQSPGSPEGPAESPRPSDGPPFPERGSPSPPSDARTFTGPALAGEGFRPPQLGPRRSSDGLVPLPDKGLGMEVLGGSLAALPREGPPSSKQPLEGESNWSLSQSFEWAFPSRAPEWEPPRSPIRKADDSALSEEGDSDGEGPAPGSKGPGEGSGSEGLRPGHSSAALDWQDMAAAESCARLGGATGAPCDQGATEAGRPGGAEATCPGGPVLQGGPAVAELKGPAEVEDAGAIWEEQDRPLLGTSPGLTKPGPGQRPAAPLLFSSAPQLAGADPCQGDDSALGRAQAGSCQGGARPGEAGSEPHPDARWLDELLASPPPSADETKRKDTLELGDPAGPEDLLGWSRKDLSSEFGIRGAHRAGEFGWASEPSPRRRDWPSGYGASEMDQDREFGTGTQDWAGAYKEMELLGDSSVGHGNWPDAYGIGDGCRQDGERCTGKPDWSSQYDVGGAESRDGELCTMKLDWSNTYGVEDSAQQDRKFGIGKPNWAPEYSVGDAVQQDRGFGTNQPDWTHEHGVGDTDLQDTAFSTSKTDWTREYGISDTDRQDREFGTSQTDWTREHGGDDTGPQDRGFGTGKPDWICEHRVSATDQQEREFGAGKPDWTREYCISATDRQEREFGAGKPDWTHECSVKTNGQGRAFGAGQPDWTCEYGVGSTAPQDKEFGPDKPDWTREFGAGDRAQQDRAFSMDKPDWLGECGIHRADRQNAVGSGSRDQGGAGELDSAAPEPSARRPGWSGNESKFPFARRDGASDFEHESQFGIIGTDRAGGFVLSALDPSSTVGTLDPAGLGESPTDWAGRSRTAGMDEPRGAGVGQSDWTRDLGLCGTDPSVRLGAVRPDDLREHRGGWMDWTSELSVSSMDPSSGLGAGGSKSPREAAEGQPDGASDLGMGGLATASGFGSVGLEELREAGVRQTDWGRELGSGAEGSTETREAGAGQMDWNSEVGIGRGQQSHGCDTGGSEPHGDSGPVGPRLSGSSTLLEGMLAKAAAHCKSPISSQHPFSSEGWGPSDAIDAQPPAAGGAWPVPSPQEEEGGTRPEGDGAPSPSDATDGGWLSTDMRRLSQPSVPGEDFSFLEDTEVLDSAIYRNRANLGRKRGHRAPALHPGGPCWPFEVEAADDWMFRDSTEPREARRGSSDEEVAEEPQSRRARPSPKGVKVSLFPGLNPSALKAKLRGRNRSAEEGAQLGGAQLGEAKEPHVQRSKSCKIPGLGGKPLVLPPKPEKSSGSDASSPHWLQALKLKKKKS